MLHLLHNILPGYVDFVALVSKLALTRLQETTTDIKVNGPERMDSILRLTLFRICALIKEFAYVLWLNAMNTL